jgi:hypothetical protein
MSTDVRCRIYEGACPPASRNVLFSAENDYAPKRFSLIRHIVCPSDEISLNHQWPELDCLAVAAEIAEIMQIGPYTSKIKRYKENIRPSPPWGKSVVKSKQQRMDMTGNRCRWWSQSIANIMERACKATTNTSLPRDRLLVSKFYNIHTYIHTYIAFI